MISRASSFFAAIFVLSSALRPAPIAHARPVFKAAAPDAPPIAAPSKPPILAAPDAPLIAATPDVAGVPAPITAATYIVMDLDSGRVLDAREPDKRMFPASTTKTMTCLVAIEKGELTDIFRASPRAAATGESGIGLIVGENQTLADLLRAAMIRSANDACVDIAEGVGGSQQEFVKMMNARAKELGARNTHFVNPHGLHDPNHYTTARDLALIGRAATRVDFLNQIARQKTAQIGGNWKIGPKRLIANRNKLLWRWAACDGLKTGYTKQAGNCLMATATKPDPTTGKPWRLIAVTMKSHPGSSFSDGERLLERAFAAYRPRQIGTGAKALWQGKVRGGAFPLVAVTVGQARLPLRAHESQALGERLEMRDLTAPIAKGARVGDAVFLANGKPIARLPLVAASDVPQTLLAKTVPSLGQRVSLLSSWQRWNTLFLLGVGALLLFSVVVARRRALRRHRRKRARPVEAFERVNVPRAASPNSSQNDVTRRPPPSRHR